MCLLNVALSMASVLSSPVLTLFELARRFPAIYEVDKQQVLLLPKVLRILTSV